MKTKFFSKSEFFLLHFRFLKMGEVAKPEGAALASAEHKIRPSVLSGISPKINPAKARGASERFWRRTWERKIAIL